MKKGSSAAVVCCSNARPKGQKQEITRLKDTLTDIGLNPVFSKYLFGNSDGSAVYGRARAEELMEFYRNEEIKLIFDISGGDQANEVLLYLDFDVIAENRKQFWGYSDLTAVLNALYVSTEYPAVFYQIRNLIYSHGETQRADVKRALFEGGKELYDVSYEWVQGNGMEGIVVGGNIRCLLKLAGTPFFPDMRGKILLLEAYSGSVPNMITYLSQLKQMGAFSQAAGILLGTFTEMESGNVKPSMPELAREFAPAGLPIAKTAEIGHGTDSKAVLIGANYRFI